MLVKVTNRMESIVYEDIDRVEWKQVVIRDWDADPEKREDYPCVAYYPMNTFKHRRYDSVNLEHCVEGWDFAHYMLPYQKEPLEGVRLLTFYGDEDSEAEPQEFVPGLELHLIRGTVFEKVILVSNIYSVYILNEAGTTVDKPKCVRYAEVPEEEETEETGLPKEDQ